MIGVLITISGMFAIILVTHNYILEAMHQETLGESISRYQSTDSTLQIHHEETFHSD
jgi:hypothetical protein